MCMESGWQKTILYGRNEMRAPYNISIGDGTIVRWVQTGRKKRNCHWEKREF